MSKPIFQKHEIYSKAKELYEFLSQKNIDKLKQQFHNCTKHGEFYKSHMIKMFHPWMAGIIDLENYSPKVIVPGAYENMPNSILKMGTDASLILPILKDDKSDLNIGNTFKSRLADPNLAFDALFELRAASYLCKYSEIRWISDSADSKKPEFSLKWKDNLTFVECKAIREESGRIFSFESFLYLTQKILEVLSIKNLYGIVHILPESTLTKNQAELNLIVKEFAQSTNLKQLGKLQLDVGLSIEYKLSPISKLYVPSILNHDLVLETQKDKVLLSAVQHVDSGQITVVSISLANQKPLAEIIINKISEAKKQLNSDYAGLILIGIQSRRPDDVLELKLDKNFSNRLNSKFNENTYKNIFALQILTDDIETHYEIGGTDPCTKYGLNFTNPNFNNPDYKDFPGGDLL